MPKRATKDEAFQFNEGTVLDAIETRYLDKSKGTFLRGIRDATGFNSKRTADGLYMGAWGSVGVQLHGYEAKVSRSDWKREIQDLSKAGQFEQFCHYWWVAAPEGCVKLEEMPVQWGLKIVSKTSEGYSVRVAKAATLNLNAKLTYSFFSSCLRQCRRDDPGNKALERSVADAYEAGRKYGAASNFADKEIARLAKKVKEHTDTVSEFEKSSGIRIDQWGHSAREVGEAVRHVLDHGVGSRPGIDRLIEYCQRVLTECTELKQLSDTLESKGIPCKPVTTSDSI